MYVMSPISYNWIFFLVLEDKPVTLRLQGPSSAIGKGRVEVLTMDNGEQSVILIGT